MTTTARDVAAALSQRVPHLGTRKLHPLLYYCQGHHLAIADRPLFPETIAAWDDGPTVPALWRDEQPVGSSDNMPESELGIVGYVVSRYSGLSGNDLANLARAEAPWKVADSHRRPGGSVAIEHAWMRDHFRTEGAPLAGDGRLPLDSPAVAELLAGAQQRFDRRYGKPTDIEEGAAGSAAERQGA
ncbi:Panacea domain-containing protein [Cryptosporangium japonicum]